MDILATLASDDYFEIFNAARGAENLGVDPKIDAALLAALSRLVGRTEQFYGSAASSIILALGARRVPGATDAIVAYGRGTETLEHYDDCQAELRMCKALVLLGDASARPFLREMFTRWELREDEVADALLALGEDDAFFRESLDSDNPDVVAAADHALGLLDPEHAVELIPRLFAMNDLDAHRKVVKQVRALGRADFARELLAKSEDWGKDLYGRFDAIEAIAAIDATAATAALEAIAENEAEPSWARLLASARLRAPAAQLIERFRVIALKPEHEHVLVLARFVFLALDEVTNGTPERGMFMDLVADIRERRFPVIKVYVDSAVRKIR